MAFNNTVVARAAASIWGLQLGYVTTQAVLAQANASGGSLDSIINAAFNDSYGNATNAQVAALFVNNLGLTGAAATDGTAYVLQQLALVAPGARGATLSAIAGQFAGLGGDPAYGVFANNFNARVAAAVVYSSTVGTQDAALGPVPSATSFNLEGGLDRLTGSAGNDTFNAYIVGGRATLEDADFIDGGAGSDTLFADMAGASFAVTPITTSVEAIKIRAQARATDTGDNNVAAEARVNLDAERISGATRFESNNSRADLIIEDVRILPSQITKDITIAFVQSDPGNVDFGVYFDQASLTANRQSSSTLTLDVIDIKGAISSNGAAPLLDSPYDGVSFSLNGALVLLQDATIDAAQTYAQLLTAVQGRLAANPLTNGVVTAALGGTFSVVDSNTGQTVTGTSIVLTATGGTFGIGNWIASAGVPALSNLYTNQTTIAATTQDLVTSTVILDDVGRGSNGGDLVIGGLSVGETSASRGVDRFEITVERTSRLQNIDSTNNWLKEVTFKNGTVNGNVSVIGNVGANGASLGAIGGGTAQDAALPGAVAQHDSFGFNDVRLIDASAMVGNVTFDAVVSSAAFNKYIVTTDTQAAPNGDNTSVPATTTQFADFIYSGGAGNDSITVQIDGAMAGSNSTVQVGREDFTFRINGGAGDDTVNLRIVESDETGGFQNWYGNQKLLRNVTIDTGTGNDTVRTPGAGDVIILTGDGNDTIYTDNTGAQDAGAVATINGGTNATNTYTNFNGFNTIVDNGQRAIWTFNTDNSATVIAAVDAREISDLRSDANNSYNLYKASVTVNFLGLTKTLQLTSTTFTPSDAFINQRIKEAINLDPVLSKLLIAQDGPAFSLVVKSLIDGEMPATALTVAITPATAADFTASELASVAAAYGLTAPATAGDVQAVFTTALADFNTAADFGTSVLVAGTSSTATALPGRNLATDIIGADSVYTSDNTVTPGAGNDVIVLGTDSAGATNLEASNDVVVYSGTFGNDTIVNFDVAGVGIDQLNVAALGGRGNAGFVNDVTVAGAAVANQANRSITIDEAGTWNDTLAEIALYFNDGQVGNATTAFTHVVIVVNPTTNIGTVYSVTDAVGGTVAAPNITAVLSGTIDLANTGWDTLVAGNFTNS